MKQILNIIIYDLIFDPIFIIKVCNVNRQFQDIIKSYRIKSNSNNSHVYRSVFIRFSDTKDEIRGDLIKLYNEVCSKQGFFKLVFS